MLDQFISGHVRRISPEAPVPVCLVSERAVMLGGVGNVARNLASIDAGVTLIAPVGDDPPAKEIETLSQQLPGASVNLVAERKRVTTVKTRFSAGGQQLLRADYETTDPIIQSTRRRILDHVRAATPERGVLLISDYAKGALPAELLRATIDVGLERECAIVVDPKGADFSRYRGATVIKPNLAELSTVVGRSLATSRDIEAGAREIIEQCEIEAVLCTRGAEGVSLIWSGGAMHLAGNAQEVFDVSGAGDTVAAVFTAGLSVGASRREAAFLANLAGGLVVAKAGTAVLDRSELRAEILARHTDQTKMISLEVARRKASGWREQGCPVAFVFGRFDQIVLAHIKSFQQARSQGRLVVGLLASDPLNNGAKPDRKAAADDARLAVLSSLSCVDAIVLVDERTVDSAVEALAPEVILDARGVDERARAEIAGCFHADVTEDLGSNNDFQSREFSPLATCHKPWADANAPGAR